MSQSSAPSTDDPTARIPLGGLEPPLALGALDGRYRPAVAPLIDHLSEAALNRNRIHVEVEWFIHLCADRVLPGIEPLSQEQIDGLRGIVEGFGAEGIAELAGDPVTTAVDLAEGSADLPPTDGLLFATDTGIRVVIRPSGTEPKLKCYLTATDQDPSLARERLMAVRDQIAALVAG